MKKIFWGSELTILCVSDRFFLPGVYALFNSLLMNDFAGKLRIIKMDDFDNNLIVAHDQLEVDLLEKRQGDFHYNVQRWNYFSKLEPGKYLFLDADFIVERPIGILLDLLSSSILLSREEEPKYDSNDILFQRQAKMAGYEPYHNSEIGYINGGLIGFTLPMHQQFVDELVEKSFAHLEGILAYTKNPDWNFIDQDMLNVVARGCGLPISVISPRQIEIGVTNKKWLFNRAFPATKQILQHDDQAKFLIHGAALRRPWLNPYPKNSTGKIRKYFYDLGANSVIKQPTPYERAWAFYSCSENLPIPVSSWASRFNFTAHKNILWRKTHGII